MNNTTKKKPRARVLVVEDEKPILRAISVTFEEAGFQVIEASDGEAGLSKALKEKPDIILLDIYMPKMNGLEVLRNLRKDSWGEKAKVVLLTNVGDVKMMSEAMGFGVYEYLIKSNWTLEDVVKKVEDKLGLKNKNT